MQPLVESPRPNEFGAAQSASDLSHDLVSTSGRFRQRAIACAFRAVRAAYLRRKPIFSWRGKEFEFVRLARALSQDYLLPRMDERMLDSFYASRPDPWGYYKEFERLRLRAALAILTAATNGAHFESALEIGCAEGAFTELLAPSCKSLLAADISAVALKRARNRREWPASIEFEKMDLVSDSLPGQFDLIVVTDVLTMIRDRRKLRTVCRKLAEATRGGGYILAGDYREEQVFETTFVGRWLGRRLLRSARWTLPILARQPGLSEVVRGQTPSHMFLVLRKNERDDGKSGWQ